MMSDTQQMTVETTRDGLKLQRLFSEGIDSLKAAGALVVELLTSGQRLPDISAASGIAVDVLGQLERIGRHQMNASLLLANYPAVPALQRLSMSEQDRLLNQPVEVLILKDGGTDTLLVEAKNLTREQVSQVFAGGSVRDLAQQRAWLESRAQKLVPPQMSELPYTITRRHTVVFKACVEMTAKELIRIAQALQD